MTWLYSRIMWLWFDCSFHLIVFMMIRLLFILFISYKMELTSVRKYFLIWKASLTTLFQTYLYPIYNLINFNLLKNIKKVTETYPIGRQPTFKFILEQYCVTQKILTVASFFDILSRDDRSITGRISGEKIQKKTFLNSKLRLEFRRSDRKLI